MNSSTTGVLQGMLSRIRPLLLDGAMGTELERRGVDVHLPLWSANALLSSPQTVRQIHEDSLRAGADIITTDTFRTTTRTFRRAGCADRSDELTAKAVLLAQEARTASGTHHALIAGSMAPLEDCYHPERVPPRAELQREHAEHAARLVEAGVDFLLLETMGTIREAYAAAEGARATRREFIVSFLCRADGMLYSGEPLGDAVRAVTALSPTALSINCVSPREISAPVRKLLDALRETVLLPFAVYANVGAPGGEHGAGFVCDVGPDEYALCAREWFLQGAAIIGGCCGTTPEHIAALAHLFRAG